MQPLIPYNVFIPLEDQVMYLNSAVEFNIPIRIPKSGMDTIVSIPGTESLRVPVSYLPSFYGICLSNLICKFCCPWCTSSTALSQSCTRYDCFCQYPSGNYRAWCRGELFAFNARTKFYQSFAHPASRRFSKRIFYYDRQISLINSCPTKINHRLNCK